MTTPSEGPGAWTPETIGRLADFMDHLSQSDFAELIETYQRTSPEQRQFMVGLVRQTENYNDRQRANVAQGLDRMANPLRDRVADAIRGTVARVHLAYDQTQERLSVAAQQLATQARQYAGAARGAAVGAYEGTRDAVNQGVDNARAAVGRAAGNIADRANEFGQQVAGAYAEGVNRVNEFGQRVADEYQTRRDQVVDLGQRGQVRLDQAWQGATDRVNEAGRQIARGAGAARDGVVNGATAAAGAVVGGATAAANASRNAVVKTGRWFEGKFNSTMRKAESALATYNASRVNLPLQQDMSQVLDDKGKLALIQQLSDSMEVVTPEVNEALQSVAQQAQTKLDTQTAMRAGLAGVAPATPGGPGQTADPSQQGTQPAANLTKNNDPKGIGGR